MADIEENPEDNTIQAGTIFYAAPIITTGKTPYIRELTATAENSIPAGDGSSILQMSLDWTITFDNSKMFFL